MSSPLHTIQRMARPRSPFRCTECGLTAPRWAGQCPACDTWNSLVEEVAPLALAHGPASRGGTVPPLAVGSRPLPLASVAPMAIPLRSTGLREFGRRLGGGPPPRFGPPGGGGACGGHAAI